MVEEEIIEPHKCKERYEHWKEKNKTIPEVSKEASDLILTYLEDLENGENTAKGSKKGKRSYARIYSNLVKLKFIFSQLNKRKIAVKDIGEKNINKIFLDMREGKLKKQNGDKFSSVGDYAKTFISFWHWYMRINHKKGKTIPEITSYLDTSKKENTFCYFEKEQLMELCKGFTKEEALMLLFQFDSIIRYPKELMNIKRSDIILEKNNGKEILWLNVREEISKTYGRKFKLLLCADRLKEYIKEKELAPEDYLFSFSAPVINRKLKKAAVKLFGDTLTLGGKKYSQISGYDLRHSGACYWRKGAYNTKIDALMYRGGWKDLDMLNYYTKKLGLKDTIEEADLLSLEDKSYLEKEINQLKEQMAVIIDSQEEGKLYKEFQKYKHKIINKEGFEASMKKLVEAGEVEEID